MARKLKIKMKINKFFIPIPSIPLSLVSGILKFSYKHSVDHLSSGITNNMYPNEIDRLINSLRNTEPFELVNINVNEKGSKVFIRIYTK